MDQGGRSPHGNSLKVLAAPASGDLLILCGICHSRLNYRHSTGIETAARPRVTSCNPSIFPSVYRLIVD